MTDPRLPRALGRRTLAGPAPAPRPRRRPRALSRNAIAVYATSAALFASVFGFLGLRVAQGHDPSLASLTAQVAPAPAPAAGAPHTRTPLRTSTSGGASATAAPATTAAGPAGTPLPGGSRHDD